MTESLKIPEITAPKFLQLAMPDGVDRPTLHVRVMLRPDTGVYTNITVEVEHPMLAVNSTMLGRLGLPARRTAALREALFTENAELAADNPRVKALLRGTRGRPVPVIIASIAPTGETLVDAILVARLAKLTGEPMVRALDRCFGLARTAPDAAAGWLADIRKTRLLHITEGVFKSSSEQTKN